MAWTQGNILWTIPFMSRAGASCRIDIYKRGYTGSQQLQLKGAADPFYFEEDNDSDLLNGVLRYSTGYIRIVETDTFDLWSDIRPTNTFDRYVEVSYDGAIVFNGYIQVQDFSNEQVPVPRILEFPVISPLGLFEKKTFSNTLYLPPSSASLGQMLDVVLSGSTYSYVYLPKNYGYPNDVGLWMEISTLVVTPWNEDYHHSESQNASSKVMKGVSHSYLIEAICKAFGWICHDTPTSLIFTAFDYEDVYCSYPVGHIGEAGYRQDSAIPSSATDLTQFFTLSDNDANIRMLMPETGIEISYEGDPETRDFSLARTYVATNNGVVIAPSFVPSGDVFPNHAEIFSLCNLVPVALCQEMSTNLNPLTFDSNDKINIGQNCVAWNGKEGFMISLSGSYETNHELFWLRFYLRKRTNQKYSLSYDMLGNKLGLIGGLAQNSDVSENYITTALDTSNQNYVQVTFKYNHGADDSDLPPLPAKALIFIYNVQLEVLENSKPYAKYLYKPATDSDVISPDGDTSSPSYAGAINPAISSQVEMPISMYRLNDHLLGTTIRFSKVTVYPYLFQPRRELTSKFRLSMLLSFPHVRLFSYMSKKWRIIAQAFHLWDDEVELTLQNSELL
jgi:hypothetical protein